jgi:hypothetical protein
MYQPHSPDRSSQSNRAGKIGPMLLALGLAAAVLVCGVWVGMVDEQSRARAGGRSVVTIASSVRRPPPAIPAAQASMAEDTPVIGVVAGDFARAYTLTSFKDIEHHVLNDTLGGVAVTVTHCPQSGCTRVYSDTASNRSLDMRVGGWLGSSVETPDNDSVMLLSLGSASYYQDSGEAVNGGEKLRYAQTDFEMTTWEEWRRKHPQTDIVVEDGMPQPGKSRR